MNTKQVGKWIAIVMAVLAAASQGALHLPVGIPEWVAPMVQSWSAFIMSIYLIVNPFLPADVVGQIKPTPPVSPPLPTPPPSKG